MAYYIENSKIFDIVCTEQGIELIKNKILEWKKEVNIEVRHKGTTDEVILIQNNISDLNSYTISNWYAVGLNITQKTIYVNPISKKLEGVDDWSASLELKDYIEKEIPIILRDNKIQQLCQ